MSSHDLALYQPIGKVLHVVVDVKPKILATSIDGKSVKIVEQCSICGYKKDMRKDTNHILNLMVPKSLFP
jgi:hypothetical protein